MGQPGGQEDFGRASLGATLAFVIVSVGASQIFNNFRGIQAPKGGARLATAKDLKAADLLNGKPGYSIFLGRFNGTDVRYSGPSHIYVNGPTRSGKGVGFVLPNALEWRGSLIGFDLKREMWAEIGAARAAMGQKDVSVLAGFARIALLESARTSCRRGRSAQRTSRTSRAASSRRRRAATPIGRKRRGACSPGFSPMCSTAKRCADAARSSPL